MYYKANIYYINITIFVFQHVFTYIAKATQDLPQMKPGRTKNENLGRTRQETEETLKPEEKLK